MSRLRLAARADLDVYFDADSRRYGFVPGSGRAIAARAAFFARYRDCPSIGFECDGRAIGGILFDGETAHIAVLPQYHGHWARLLAPALDWLFALQPVIFAEVEADNAVCLGFMRRNGWPAVARRGHWIVHRMTKRA
ncbi:GNAT family N-acetyltransferase [Paraburkholderia sp. Ac-20340]|uniref:GNAT family N-acetyltransferase n=1 Tax=Paraburkholderia sp. Ac-20340 TaxID=2703888 RepID=UPI00198001FB|nr:GNAT family N-acetyltransferase [Paraburkholderia sp. Ac-20340]MBN3857564.1 GNAT family N-acetyltransferase [Paraburkholderia sp. Ac-20340]